jgi:hypothetical protein
MIRDQQECLTLASYVIRDGDEMPVTVNLSQSDNGVEFDAAFLMDGTRFEPSEHETERFLAEADEADWSAS